jgi:hypothetical protein
VRKIEKEMLDVYQLFGKGSLEFHYPDCGHDFPNDIREKAYAWLQEVL